jgi:hypothetical protein
VECAAKGDAGSCGSKVAWQDYWGSIMTGNAKTYDMGDVLFDALGVAPLTGAALNSIGKSGKKVALEIVEHFGGTTKIVKEGIEALEAGAVRAGFGPAELGVIKSEANAAGIAADELGAKFRRNIEYSTDLINLTPKSATHVFEGEFTVDGLLKGGLHTPDATTKFIGTLPADVQKQIMRETLPNGVERTVFPSEAMTVPHYAATTKASKGGRGVPGGKTSFPANWDNKKIDDAIGEVMKNGDIIKDKDGRIVKEGIFDSIKIEVNIGPKSGGGSQVNSAFPSWNQ